MKKQEQILKAMDPEQRHQWALTRLQAFFRRLRSEGYTFAEVADAAIVLGGAHYAAAEDKEKTAARLMMLARRILDPTGHNPLPKIDDVPEKPEVVH